MDYTRSINATDMLFCNRNSDGTWRGTSQSMVVVA